MIILDAMEYATDAAAKAAWLSDMSALPELYHWKCNDNLGTTVVIDARGAKDGTSYRNTNMMSVAGKIDKAFSFNGSSDYINLGSFTSHDTFFLSFWLLNKGTNKVWHMLSKLPDKDAWSNWGINKDSRDAVQFSLYGEHYAFSTWSALSNGDHLMFVGANKVLKVYKNNALLATLTYAKNFSDSSTGTLSIGRAGAGNRYYFDGILDDIRYGNFEPTEEKRNAIYNSGSGTEASIGDEYIDVSAESTIKHDGSYSLKIIAPATDSVNKAVTHSISPTFNLSGQKEIKFPIRASRTGSNFKLGFHDSGGTTTEVTPNIASADTWQEVTLDISAVADANKDALDSIILTITNADAENTIYLDYITAWSEDEGAGTGGVSRSRMMI